MRWYWVDTAPKKCRPDDQSTSLALLAGSRNAKKCY